MKNKTYYGIDMAEQGDNDYSVILKVKHNTKTGVSKVLSMIKLPSLYKREPIKKQTERNAVYKEGRA